jgi:hypothetical protein
MIAARVFTPVGISIARERITSVEGGNRMAVERAVENSSSGSNPAEEKRLEKRSVRSFSDRGIFAIINGRFFLPKQIRALSSVG